jgi:hypothetical protein
VVSTVGRLRDAVLKQHGLVSYQAMMCARPAIKRHRAGVQVVCEHKVG